LLLALSGVAPAAEPTEAVRPFYERPGLELEPAERNRFVDPARHILDLNDAIKGEGEPDGCLDPALAFDDSDYVPTEVMQSLNLTETVNGDEAKVLATFKVAASDKVPDGIARMEWRLSKVDGAWKVADLVSLSKDWALSQFNCE
jgi:hypothetical protein